MTLFQPLQMPMNLYTHLRCLSIFRNLLHIRPTTIDRELPDGPTFPPRPVYIPTNPGNDCYKYLSHEPCTVFAGAPSSFFKEPDARYASLMRKRALQIGVKPEDITYSIDGHTRTRTEIVHHNDFHFELTTTFSLLSTSKKLKDTSSQTDRQQQRCTENCHGCGNTLSFTCLKILNCIKSCILHKWSCNPLNHLNFENTVILKICLKFLS